MNNFNFSVIEGNLKADPDLKTDAAGKPFCNFDIECERTYTDKSGVKQIKSNSFKIITSGKLAVCCTSYLKKGSRVLVSGELTESHINCKEVNFIGA